MRVRIDDTGRESQAFAIDNINRLGVTLSYRLNSSITYGNVAAHRCGGGAIDDQYVAD